MSWWKAARRRAKQKVLEATGACDAVEDEEWEELYAEFRKDASAVKALHKRIQGIVPIFSTFTSDLREEVREMNQYFSSRECPQDLRESTTACERAFDKVSRALWPNVEEMWTTSLLPLKKIIEEEIPAIKDKAKERSGMMTDVNSYRRKLQKLLSNEKADPERKVVVKGKLDRAVRSFEALDVQLKSQLSQFHSKRFEMMRPFVQMTLFAQLDVLGRSADMLAQAVKPLPEDAKKAVLESLAHKHSTKGMRRDNTERGTIAHSFGFESERSSASSKSDTTTADRNAAASNESDAERTQTRSETIVDPFADIAEAVPTDTHSSKTSTTAPDKSSDGEEYVIADFDFSSDDAGDLPFKKGDKIRVLGREGGWWRGELDGKIGMFPHNYTHAYTADE